VTHGEPIASLLLGGRFGESLGGSLGGSIGGALAGRLGLVGGGVRGGGFLDGRLLRNAGRSLFDCRTG